MADTLLQVEQLCAGYGHIQALRGVDIEVKKGEIVSLVGANGAGKSTLLLSISRLIKHTAGTLHFKGRLLDNYAPHQTVRLGIVQVPEGRALFSSMTVLENLEIGAITRRDQREIERDRAMILARFPVLEKRARTLAGNLSGGEQQMLALGRALMARPELLLLDEPSMGLAPLIVEQIFEVLLDIHRSGVSVLLVEQNVKQALKIAHRGYVLETGKVALSDTGPALLNNPKVIEAYLGG